MLRLVACSLLTSLLASGAAHGEPAKLRAVENRGSTYPLTELTGAVFTVREGWFGELGLCSARRRGLVSSYACGSLDVGRQDGGWIVSDVVEWGLRLQPTQRFSLQAGGGFSLLTLFVNGLACAGAASGSAGADGPADMPRRTETCDARLPMQFYPGLRARLAVPVASLDIVLVGSARYVIPVAGRVGFEAPSGVAIALGAGIAF